MLIFDGLPQFHPNREPGVQQFECFSDILRPKLKRGRQPRKNPVNLFLGGGGSNRRPWAAILASASGVVSMFMDGVFWAIRFAAAGSRLNGSVIGSLSNSREAMSGASANAFTIRRASSSNSFSSRACCLRYRLVVGGVDVNVLDRKLSSSNLSSASEWDSSSLPARNDRQTDAHG